MSTVACQASAAAECSGIDLLAHRHAAARCHAQAAAKQGLTDTLRAAIVDHRNTWITEDDFSLMAGAGINAVRIPVGYWVLATSQVCPLLY